LAVFALLVQQLLSIEAAPLVLENCRQSNLVVTHIKVDVSGERIPEAYIVPLVHAMIGVLRNRFSVLWDPAMECLAALVDTGGATSWDAVTAYLQSFQEDFLSQPVLKSSKREDAADDSITIPQGDDLLYIGQAHYLVSFSASDVGCKLCIGQFYFQHYIVGDLFFISAFVYYVVY
jgi:hypothetical protein